ncbi:MAG: aminotransferase class V-fold PLP-dependent enzyme [candidate division Zixibacteria bacterium]|nr:aminotransferase class V-fold PLP-dependent enzyme [candidate division Zixibacteria bacterium]
MNAFLSGPFNRLDRRVFEAMLPYFTERFGNAASLNHVFGWAAQDACDRAREQVAVSIGAHATREIVFTGSGAEAALLAVKGVADAYASRGRHIVSAAPSESPADMACRHLENDGYRISRLGLDGCGRLDPDRVRAALQDKTVLITLPLACDELGVEQPIAEISSIARATGTLLHVDGGALLDRISVDVRQQAIDLLSMDATALCGPSGTGALYIRGRAPRVTLSSLIDGGGQERGFRSGTLNVPGIVGMGAAFAIVLAERETEMDRLRRLTAILTNGVAADAVTLVTEKDRCPGVAALAFSGMDHRLLVERMTQMENGEPVSAHVAPLSQQTSQACGQTSGITVVFSRYAVETDAVRLSDVLRATTQTLRAGTAVATRN